ncbi:MAG TPA: EamA family transporter [Bryobacteraceae bacterium]|nr:EamA family transporter [Bryobacteraceae bacterium]
MVLSAITHAYWNFLLKRSGGSPAVIGLSKIAEAIILGPLLFTGIGTDPTRLTELWRLPVVGAALVFLNYVFLTAAYRRGELSLVYPISRGAILMFLPPLALLTIGETITALGWVAIGLIVIGIGSVQVPGAIRGTATIYALVAAFTAACYTIWDKQAVQALTPLTYFSAYTVLVGFAYLFILVRTTSMDSALAVWRLERGVIVQVAILNIGSYMLTLMALRSGHASYVIALRQLSIAVGAILGWRLLGEALSPMRQLGVGLVVAGCVLLALVR